MPARRTSKFPIRTVSEELVRLMHRGDLTNDERQTLVILLTERLKHAEPDPLPERVMLMIGQLIELELDTRTPRIVAARTLGYMAKPFSGRAADTGESLPRELVRRATVLARDLQCID